MLEQMDDTHFAVEEQEAQNQYTCYVQLMPVSHLM